MIGINGSLNFTLWPGQIISDFSTGNWASAELNYLVDLVWTSLDERSTSSEDLACEDGNEELRVCPPPPPPFSFLLN